MPTWAFYFSQVDASCGYGWTRSLRTGERGYPELIRDMTNDLDIVDVLLMPIETDCNLGRLSDRYRSVQKQRIKKARSPEVSHS